MVNFRLLLQSWCQVDEQPQTQVSAAHLTSSSHRLCPGNEEAGPHPGFPGFQVAGSHPFPHRRSPRPRNADED